MRGVDRWCVYGVLSAVGGFRLPPRLRIPAEPDVLILMNHQSLFDIPIAIDSVDASYPIIVTRRRYASGIPLVSHMLRLYRFPLVDPGRDRAGQLQALAAAAAAADRPFLIFPEGHRTKDGEIRPFKIGGLEAILAQKQWQIHVLVVDGFWQCARLGDFVRSASRIRGTASVAGPFTHDASTESVEAFAERMREQMRTQLHDLRTTHAPEV